MPSSESMDSIRQKAEWRGRLAAVMLNKTHDDDTRLALLEAGLDQAHSEGVLDCAEICENIARGSSNLAVVRFAATIAKTLREFDARNRK